MPAPRSLAAIAGSWVLAYLGLYGLLIGRGDGELALWYAVLLLVIAALLGLVAVGRLSVAGLAAASALLLPATVLALLSIGVVLVPALLLAVVALARTFGRTRTSP